MSYTRIFLYSFDAPSHPPPPSTPDGSAPVRRKGAASEGPAGLSRPLNEALCTHNANTVARSARLVYATYVLYVAVARSAF